MLSGFYPQVIPRSQLSCENIVSFAKLPNSSFVVKIEQETTNLPFAEGFLYRIADVIRLSSGLEILKVSNPSSKK
jgi:hypothetical protein